MRYVDIEDAKPGMILAQNLFDSRGRTLLGGYNILNETYIERLKSYGFSGVYVDDEVSKDIVVESIISPKLRMEGVECIKNKDTEECNNVSKKMVIEIIGNGTLTLDLIDLRSYDDYTLAHSVNVAMVCGVMGIGMGLKESQLTKLVQAALLHDLGKLEISQKILNKPERLSKEEYEIMKTHAMKSYEIIVDRWDISPEVKAAVLFHHENVDGSGYPLGIDGSKQTIYTKILHVADVYDALVSKRPYKEPYSPFEASEYLMGGCGILFDETAVKSLLRYVPFYPKGLQITLSDGRKGIVYDNVGEHNLRPVVKLLDGEILDLNEPQNLNIIVAPPKGKEFQVREESEAKRIEMIKPLREFKRFSLAAIDDSSVNLQLLKDLLEETYDIKLFKTGEQFLRYIESGNIPDLVLMDIEMPGLNGIEIAEKLRKIVGKHLPVLFITGNSDKETVLKCRQLGAAGYILRPYRATYVKAEIRRILMGWCEC